MTPTQQLKALSEWLDQLHTEAEAAAAKHQRSELFGDFYRGHASGLRLALQVLHVYSDGKYGADHVTPS